MQYRWASMYLIYKVLDNEMIVCRTFTSLVSQTNRLATDRRPIVYNSESEPYFLHN